MSRSWRRIYAELTDFITRNPQVKLGQEVIEIPESHREEFYRLFNLTRSTFIEEECSRLIEQAKPLSLNYLQAERDIINTLGLSEVSLHPKLRWFMDNPVDGLMRVLFDPLFDLLRGRIQIEEFKNLGCKSAHKLNYTMKTQAYEYWLTLSLTNLLKPSKLFVVNIEVGSSSQASVQAVQPDEKPIRDPEESKILSLVHQDYSIFTIPDIITHSTIINHFVAIRTEPGPAAWTATNASEKMEWLPIDQGMLFTPGIVIINIGDNPEDLSLIRDNEKISRPDMVLICREPVEWDEKEYLEEIIFCLNILKPRLGTYIVSRYSVPKEFTDRLSFQESLSRLSSSQRPEVNTEGIQILDVGFDKSKLSPIINTLASLESRDTSD